MADSDIESVAFLVAAHHGNQAKSLHRTCIAITRRISASGMDKNHIRVAQSLPINAWHLLARIFNLLEAGQEWPCALSAVVVAAIPKTDTVSALKVSQDLVYRVWSALRAEQANTQWLPKLMNAIRSAA